MMEEEDRMAPLNMALLSQELAADNLTLLACLRRMAEAACSEFEKRMFELCIEEESRRLAVEGRSHPEDECTIWMPVP